MPRLIKFCWYFLCLAILGMSIGKAQESLLERQFDGVEINGLIVDETITKVGRDFYELFYQGWVAPVTTVSYSLFVREQPLNGLGSKVIVFVNDTEVFSQALQPRYDAVEAVSRQAVEAVQNYLGNYETFLQQLGSEDQQGSGIY